MCAEDPFRLPRPNLRAQVNLAAKPAVSYRGAVLPSLLFPAGSGRVRHDPASHRKSVAAVSGPQPKYDGFSDLPVSVFRTFFLPFPTRPPHHDSGPGRVRRCTMLGLPEL